MTPGTLDVGLVFNKTLETFKRMAGPLIGFTALMILPLSVVTGALSTWFQFIKDDPESNPALLGGVVLGLIFFSFLQVLVQQIYTAVVCRAVVDVQDGRLDATFESLLQGIRSADVVNLLITGLLVGLGVGVGVLFCIAPGIYLAVSWAVAIPVVSLEGLSGPEALKRSNQLVEGNRWQAFAVLFVFVIVGMAVGTLLCCCGPIASLVTAPLAAISSTELYLALKGGGDVSSESPVSYT
jgi:uncharacterized membrane protein